jgi:hypothetical protein
MLTLYVAKYSFSAFMLVCPNPTDLSVRSPADNPADTPNAPPELQETLVAMCRRDYITYADAWTSALVKPFSARDF